MTRSGEVLRLSNRDWLKILFAVVLHVCLLWAFFWRVWADHEKRITVIETTQPMIVETLREIHDDVRKDRHGHRRSE